MTLEWRHFADGALMPTELVILPLGEGSAGAVMIDPRDRPQLPDGQYSVTVSAANGPAVAIVLELATGGDSFMIYEGFAAPGP